MEMIKSENLSFKIGNKLLLKNVNISIHEQEHTVLWGLNGSGKTILTSILSGYRAFSEGSLRLFDQEVTLDNIDVLRRRIGYISNSFFDYYYHKECALDIVLSGKFGKLGIDYGITKEDVGKAKRLLNRMGISAGGRYPYSSLSKGQKQAVLISRAFINDPSILILDEACDGLDVLSRSMFLNTIAYLAKEHKTTILLISHYPEEILPFFKKIILLDKGEIYKQGIIDEVFTSEIVSKFLGEKIEIKKIYDEWKFKCFRDVII